MDQVQQHRISRADVIRMAAKCIVDGPDATAEFTPNKRDEDGEDNPFIRITFVTDTWSTIEGLVKAATGEDDVESDAGESDLEAAVLIDAVVEGHAIMETYSVAAEAEEAE